MEDKTTKTISLALYHYMCHNIVGTDNYVKTLRLMNTVRDDTKINEQNAVITSGSFGEGLEMRGSDLDLMFVNTKDIKVYEDSKTDYNSNGIFLSMETDDVKPGFTMLLVEYIKPIMSFMVCKYCEELNGKLYFSSALHKQQLLDHVLDSGGVMHGPCVSDKNGMFDHVMCLRCTSWISQASQWITRSNNSWPSYDVKQSILKHGVLFVPIGVKGSPKEDIEWRISFSVGEKFLINTFTHTQLICYALLKILLKDVIASCDGCKDLLCSYFLKTIIFWISEELPQSIWKTQNLIICFMRCFNRLIYSVDYSSCLHYFIPENNMFENKIEGRAREILLQKLYLLHSYGWRCILFSDQLSNFHASMLMNPIEPKTLHTIEVAKRLNSVLLYFATEAARVFEWDTYAYKRGIHQIVTCDQSSLKYLYTYYFSMWCGQGAQTFQLNSSKSSNKHQYKQYTSCLCTLLQNIYHDSVSGWLMLASFFYKIKQYGKASTIIEYSISKCIPEKLHFTMKMSYMHHQLLELKSFQKKSIVQLWKLMLIGNFVFHRNSELIPGELQVELETEDENYHFPPLAYAYFLNFLCHYHLNNVRQCQYCIRDLQLVVAQHCFMQDQVEIAQVYNFLGISFQMLGDFESARQAFMHSVEILQNDRSNHAVTVEAKRKFHNTMKQHNYTYIL